MPGFMDFMGGGQPVNFQQASSFQQTLQPQPPVQQTPPSTPQELEQRKAGWHGFIDRLQNDPALRTAAFMTAAQLMRGPDVGESMAGGIGRALQLGTLAHSFMSSNQARQQMDQQKLDEQRRVNDANIAATQANTAQSQAQTNNMEQNRLFELEDRPLIRRSKELKVNQEEFADSHKEIDQLQKNETSNMQREVMAAQRDNLRRDPVRSAGASTQITNDREDRLIRSANPQLEGETPEAYEQRIAQLTLSRGVKSGDAVRVQAAQNILNNSDPGSPEYEEALSVMRSVSAGSKAAPAANDKAAWEKARNSVKPGEAYQGPDGKTYIRKS